MGTSENWDRYREWLCDLPELGFRLDVSRMGLSTEWIDSMASRIGGAIGAMVDLEAGAVANPDENRRVGHYWLRSPDLAPSEEIRVQIEAAVDAVVQFADRIHRGETTPPSGGRFEHLLVVGIGGSALGPQFVADALGASTDRMTLQFLDNTDPHGIDRVIGRLGNDLARTLTVVISKSGGTPETRNGMLETAEAYRSHGLDFGKHAVAITQDGSKLDAYAKSSRFLARFPMWDWVGGRTSQTSAVGLLPAALQGVEIRRLLRGASAMDAATRETDPRRNPAALIALCWYHAGEGRGSRDMVVLPYKDRLMLLGRYLQQLIMESIGKEKDLDGKTVHQGLSVYGNKGSTDQHAYVQQLRDGLANFFVTFVEVLKDRNGTSIEVEDGVTTGDFLQGFFLGTRTALHDNDRNSMTLTLRDVDPESVGGLVALFERAVGLYASLIHVNAYHQPGVEAGKKAAASVLALQARLFTALGEAGTDGATCEALARSIGAEDEVETLFMLLERFVANADRGVSRRPGATPFDAVYSIENG